MAGERYLKPGRFTRKVFNPAVRGLTRLGISVWGSRELRVRGRKSGQWRATPVNLLTVDGERYLLAPRGTTDWVRNLRAAGSGELWVGRRCDQFAAIELDDASKPAIVREYLRRWKFEAGYWQSRAVFRYSASARVVRQIPCQVNTTAANLICDTRHQLTKTMD
jgi:deazaflavin-dependent oxidoreductase (nitroreductase family)